MIRDGAFRKAVDSAIVNCVEVAALPQGGVRVRDSKDPGGPVVSYTDQEWHGFIQAIKDGEFESHP